MAEIQHFGNFGVLLVSSLVAAFMLEHVNVLYKTDRFVHPMLDSFLRLTLLSPTTISRKTNLAGEGPRSCYMT